MELLQYNVHSPLTQGGGDSDLTPPLDRQGFFANGGIVNKEGDDFEGVNGCHTTKCPDIFLPATPKLIVVKSYVFHY